MWTQVNEDGGAVAEKSFTGNISDKIPNISYNQGVDHIKMQTYFCKHKHNMQKYTNKTAYIMMIQW